MDATRTPPAGQARTRDPIGRRKEIERQLRLLHRAGDVFEVRALNVPGSGSFAFTASGYFNNPQKAATAADLYSERGASGVYVTLNPCQPDLLARASNRMRERTKHTTADAEVLLRRWMFVDIDPVRPSGIAATDEEVAAARELAVEIEDLLRARGWPVPLLAESGNGYYLLWKLPGVPNTPQVTATLKAAYAALESKLSTVDPSKPHAHLDTGVFNAARIIRVGGTHNRKGDPTDDRPHRVCQYHEPDPDQPVEPVAWELVEALAAEVPGTAAPASTSCSSASTHTGNGQHRSRLDVPRYLGDRGIDFREKAGRGCTHYIVPCPFDESHGHNGEAAVVQRDDGMLCFECKHNSCSERRWADYKDAIGKPDANHYDPPLDKKPKLASQPAQPGGESQPEEPPPFVDLIDTPTLFDRNYETKFLVDSVLVRGQPMVIGGRSKAMKTSIATAMTLALGSGTPFLGKWPANKCRVAFWSGESGAATIQETAKRQAAAMGVTAADLSVRWNFILPKLSRQQHLDHLARLIEHHKLDVVVIDPLYLSLLEPEDANNVGNVFAMGAKLQPLSEIAQASGCTPIVLHHFRKNAQAANDQPELEELSQAGFAEWCRQWLLLSRRTPYNHDGHHELWMRFGGSAGHAGCVSVDIDEGTFDANDLTSRRWEVAVERVGDVTAAAKSNREQQRKQQAERNQADIERRVFDALRSFPDGETVNMLKGAAKMNTDIFHRGLAAMLKEGYAEPCEVSKGRGTYAGYRPTKRAFDEVDE